MEWDVDIKPTESIYEVLECVCGDNKIPPEVKHTFKATTERELKSTGNYYRNSRKYKITA